METVSNSYTCTGGLLVRGPAQQTGVPHRLSQARHCNRAVFEFEPPKPLEGNMSTSSATSHIPHNGTQPANSLTSAFSPTATECSDPENIFQVLPRVPPSFYDYVNSLAGPYYSLGICPYGMTSVTTPISGFGPPIESTETAIVCCLRYD